MIKGKGYKPAENLPRESDRNEEDLPGVLNSFLPIIVPLLLITLKSVAAMIGKSGEIIYRILYFPGDPVFALFIGVLLSLLLLRKKKH